MNVTVFEFAGIPVWEAIGPTRIWRMHDSVDSIPQVVEFFSVRGECGTEAPRHLCGFTHFDTAVRWQPGGAVQVPAGLDAEGYDAFTSLWQQYANWRNEVDHWYQQQAYQRQAMRENPRAQEWDVLPPNTPYPCHPWEKKMLGKRVPGRNGGVVTQCATPREPVGAPKRKAQVYIEGVGVMPRQRAYNRLRQANVKRISTPRETVGAAVYGFDTAECPVPGPTGMEFPHVVSRCDLSHPAWEGYMEALGDAQEHAAIFAENSGPTEYECAVRDALMAHPKYALWMQIATDCARMFHEREEKRRGKATFSTARESAQKRVRALAAGMDVTSAEYFDTLRGGEGRARRRRR